jgi:predicted enzyme related to lactoylglutathione lyase
VQAVRLGGRVLVAPHPDRHGGMVAVVADPAGAAVGLMEWTETEGTR